MSEDKPANPSQIVIQTDNLFGRKDVEKINLDNNFVNPRAEFEQNLADMLIGRTPEDTVFAAFSTVSFGSLISTVLYHTTLLEPVYIPLGIVGLVMVFFLIYAIAHLPKIGIPLLFRLIFVAIGSTIGAFL